MRRVSVVKARLGMVLARSVYDVRGRGVLEEAEVLSEQSLLLLGRSGVSEIMVEDPRVADVPVGSLFPAHLEAKAVQSIHVFLVMHQGSTEPIVRAHLVGIESSVHAMVSRLFPQILGDPDISGCLSLQGYDYVHPVTVTGLSLLVGRLAGLDEKELFKLGMAAMLENVGYIALPPGVMEKTGPFDSLDREAMQRHPVYGVELLKDAGLDPGILQIIEQHHERWNGSGFPKGMRRDEISPMAQIIAMADTYHALLSRRPHRNALRPHEAVEFVISYSGELFDPELTQFFARKVPHYLPGSVVQLSTGEVGIISNPNLGHIARPKVRICAVGGRPVRNPFDLDLSEVQHMSRLITEVLS